MSRLVTLSCLCLFVFGAYFANPPAAADSPFQLLQTYGIGEVTSLSFSPDSQQLLTSHNDLKVRLWDYKQGKVLNTVFTGAVTQLAFMPDGTHFVCAYVDGTTRLYTVSSGQYVANFFNTGVSDAIAAMAVSSDNKNLAIAAGNSAYLFDIPTGNKSQTFTGHTDKINALAISTDGVMLGTASNDGSAKIYEAATGNLKATATHKTVTPLTSIAFSPGAFPPVPYSFATGGSDGSVWAWYYFTPTYFGPQDNFQMQSQVGYLKFYFNQTPTSVTFTLLALDGRSLLVWDLLNHQQLREFSPLLSAGVGLVCPDSSIFAAGSCTSDTKYSLLFLDYATFTPKNYSVPGPPFLGAGFVPDTGEVYTVSQPAIVFYNKMTGEETRRVPGDWGRLVVARNGSKAYVSKDVVHVWDLSSDTETGAFTECNNPQLGVLSHDEKLLAAPNGPWTPIWNIETGTLLGQFTFAELVSFSPDDKEVALGTGGGGTSLWDIATGAKLWEQDYLYPATFLNDGKYVAGALYGNILLLSPADGSTQISTLFPVHP